MLDHVDIEPGLTPLGVPHRPRSADRRSARPGAGNRSRALTQRPSTGIVGREATGGKSPPFLGSLDVYAPNNTKAVPELQRIFAETILKLETLPDGGIDKRVYDLDPLADPTFEFQLPPGSGITKAIVTKMRLTLKHGARRRVLNAASERSLFSLRPRHLSHSGRHRV
jgi:hypothetical protein